MDKVIEQKIAEIDGYRFLPSSLGGCYITREAAGPAVDLPDFDDEGVMLGVINRWVADSGDGSPDASERTLAHNYDGHNHQISLWRCTHVFDDSAGRGEQSEAFGEHEDYAKAAQAALLKVEGV